jgi:formamidopyrimidine-DNA glycosylase
MPELPDVEVFRRYFSAHALRQVIVSVEVRAEKILEDITPGALLDALEGRLFERTGRHGKHLFAFPDSGPCLTMHFGMTGFLRYGHGDICDGHTRLVIGFENGNILAYNDQRMFGRIGIADSVAAYIERKGLGEDALTIPPDRFRDCVLSRRVSVKTALMNQQLLAGIGNVYSDEILFQARIHPLRGTGSLSDGEIDVLYRAMKNVLEVAIGRGADPATMPDTYLLSRRKAGTDCPGCGGPVRKVVISGRSAYFCDCQR